MNKFICNLSLILSIFCSGSVAYAAWTPWTEGTPMRIGANSCEKYRSNVANIVDSGFNGKVQMLSDCDGGFLKTQWRLYYIFTPSQSTSTKHCYQTYNYGEALQQNKSCIAMYNSIRNMSNSDIYIRVDDICTLKTHSGMYCAHTDLKINITE